MRFRNLGNQRPMHNRRPKKAFAKRAIYQRIELYNKKDTSSDSEKEE